MERAWVALSSCVRRRRLAARYCFCSSHAWAACRQASCVAVSITSRAAGRSDAAAEGGAAAEPHHSSPNTGIRCQQTCFTALLSHARCARASQRSPNPKPQETAHDGVLGSAGHGEVRRQAGGRHHRLPLPLLLAVAGHLVVVALVDVLRSRGALRRGRARARRARRAECTPAPARQTWWQHSAEADAPSSLHDAAVHAGSPTSRAGVAVTGTTFRQHSERQLPPTEARVSRQIKNPA